MRWIDFRTLVDGLIDASSATRSSSSSNRSPSGVNRAKQYKYASWLDPNQHEVELHYDGDEQMVPPSPATNKSVRNSAIKISSCRADNPPNRGCVACV